MGNPTGFLQIARRMPAARNIADRTRDFAEVYQPFSPNQAADQASRCMDCGVPFCQKGCPLGNHIPDWNDLVFHQRWQAAHHRLAATNNFPEFTGRLCPAPCEAACTLAINSKAVTIEKIEQEIIERAFAEGWVGVRVPSARSGKQVAIVGSGPAGLAAASELNMKGHTIHVYESSPRIGGLLRYGIPDFKLEKSVLDRRLDLLRREGIEFFSGVTIGVDLMWRDLQSRYDAVLIATGAGRPRDLLVPGRQLPGVLFAMDFLTEQNRAIHDGDSPRAELNVADKKVIILGGGDTGSDCLGTALRQRAQSVIQLELMPMPPGERSEQNPWPEWPLVYRQSSSQEEGGDREFAVLTKHLHGEGRLQALHAVRIAPNAKGFEEILGSGFSLLADVVILAMGFLGPQTEPLVDQLRIALDSRGALATDANYATNVPKIYAAGDARRGQSLIVWAIAEGRSAAAAIHRGLTNDAT